MLHRLHGPYVMTFGWYRFSYNFWVLLLRKGQNSGSSVDHAWALEHQDMFLGYLRRHPSIFVSSAMLNMVPQQWPLPKSMLGNCQVSHIYLPWGGSEEQILRTLAIVPLTPLFISSFPSPIKARRRRFFPFLNIRTIASAVTFVEETDLTSLEPPKHFSFWFFPHWGHANTCPSNNWYFTLYLLRIQKNTFDVSFCWAIILV